MDGKTEPPHPMDAGLGHVVCLVNGMLAELYTINCVCVCVCVSSAPRPLEASDLHQEKNTNLSLNHRMSPVEQTHSLEPIPADLQTHECILGVVYAELRAAFSCSIIATKADHSGGTDGEKLL